MEIRYQAILRHPHHVSMRHRPMSMPSRAAQFASFKALDGYEKMIAAQAKRAFAQIASQQERIR